MKVLLYLASAIMVIPSKEMRCPIFTRCEEKDDIIIFPQNQDKNKHIKELVDLFPKNVPTSPLDPQIYFTDLKSTLTSRTSTTPLSLGEYLREGQCQYTCKKTGGCKTELVVTGANITEEWYTVTINIFSFQSK